MTVYKPENVKLTIDGSEVNLNEPFMKLNSIRKTISFDCEIYVDDWEKIEKCFKEINNEYKI